MIYFLFTFFLGPNGLQTHTTPKGKLTLGLRAIGRMFHLQWTRAWALTLFELAAWPLRPRPRLVSVTRFTKVGCTPAEPYSYRATESTFPRTVVMKGAVNTQPQKRIVSETKDENATQCLEYKMKKLQYK